MRILADSNILFVKEAFTHFGHVILSDGREITREKLKDIDILLVRSVTPVGAELLQGTTVKFVASATTGTDHVDLKYLRENSIGFAHAPGSNANSVAEYVVSALVHCAGRKGIRIENLTLGIVGVGNIGARVLTLSRVLGMRSLLNDPPKRAVTGSDIYLPLKTVLAESDIVTVHVPLVASGSAATHRMVNTDFISSMKMGAFLINTSRGDVLDENDLREYRQRLGCVALDVWNNEPAPDPRTIGVCDLATPHIAGYSYDGKVRGTEMIYNATCSFFFSEGTWRPPVAGDGEKPRPIVIKSASDPVAEAVLHAYPILEDDALFRKICSIDASRRAEFFDEMRSDYPKRFEFCNYTVAAGKNVPSSAITLLAGLGFVVSGGE